MLFNLHLKSKSELRELYRSIKKQIKWHREFMKNSDDIEYSIYQLDNLEMQLDMVVEAGEAL